MKFDHLVSTMPTTFSHPITGTTRTMYFTKRLVDVDDGDVLRVEYDVQIPDVADKLVASVEMSLTSAPGVVAADVLGILRRAGMHDAQMMLGVPLT